jgi:putative spermidine/putrescine transport system permease protein
VAGQGVALPVARTRRRATDGTGALWLLALPAAFLAVFLVAPLVFVFATAIEESGVRGSLDAITSSLFIRSVWRTLVLALTVSALCTGLGLVYSLALGATRGTWRAVLLGVIFVSFWVSLLVRTYGWVLIYQPQGPLHDLLATFGLIHGPLDLLKTTPAMYPAMVHIMLPYTVLPLYAAVMSLDREQVAAAQSLGARPGLILRRVILPQLRGALVAGALLVFMLSLGFYVTPAVLGGPGNLTIATVIDQQFNQAYDFGAASAMGAAVLVLMIALYLATDRVFARATQWQGGA